ncbi:hypothetical protein BC831DRAFT_450622 [Entophlyctis helioformis]|nr:hypothetical protein BC831DRAFT_450622 [Entophlyctis helioformis]
MRGVCLGCLLVVFRLSSRTDCRTLRAKPHATDKRWCLGSLHSSSTKCMTKDTDKRHTGGPWLVLDGGSAGVDPRQRRRCDLALLATTNGARAHSRSITGQRLHKPSSEGSDGAQSSRSNDGSSHRLSAAALAQPPTHDHRPQPSAACPTSSDLVRNAPAAALAALARCALVRSHQRHTPAAMSSHRQPCHVCQPDSHTLSLPAAVLSGFSTRSNAR